MDNERKSLETTLGFAADYLSHEPKEFMVTRLQGGDGAEALAISFIDHRFIPLLDAGEGSAPNVKLERQFRNTVTIDRALWDNLVQVVNQISSPAQRHD